MKLNEKMMEGKRNLINVDAYNWISPHQKVKWGECDSHPKTNIANFLFEENS